MITATFLDEISHDIPSANWGRDEWKRDFGAMRDAGIDTVVLIRAGHRDRATFDSRVLRSRHRHLIVQDDLVRWFLDLAAEHGMGFWFGTYDSGEHWMNGDPATEARINRDFWWDELTGPGCPAFEAVRRSNALDHAGGLVDREVVEAGQPGPVSSSHRRRGRRRSRRRGSHAGGGTSRGGRGSRRSRTRRRSPCRCRGCPRSSSARTPARRRRGPRGSDSRR
jgi:uncharacterized membrane protein YgcG